MISSLLKKLLGLETEPPKLVFHPPDESLVSLENQFVGALFDDEGCTEAYLAKVEYKTFSKTSFPHSLFINTSTPKKTLLKAMALRDLGCFSFLDPVYFDDLEDDQIDALKESAHQICLEA